MNIPGRSEHGGNWRQRKNGRNDHGVNRRNGLVGEIHDGRNDHERYGRSEGGWEILA